jgi:hypothetical protein
MRWRRNGKFERPDAARATSIISNTCPQVLVVGDEQLTRYRR